MPTPSFPGPPVVPIVGGKATWNGRTIQECSDAIRWLSEATGGVLLMTTSEGGASLAELEARVAALEAAGSGGVPQADFDALVVRVTTLEGSVATLDTDLDTTNTDLDALEARVVALEAPAP